MEALLESLISGDRSLEVGKVSNFRWHLYVSTHERKIGHKQFSDTSEENHVGMKATAYMEYDCAG